MDEAFGQYAAADANIEKIMASMDAQIIAIRNKHAPKLLSLEQEKAEAFDTIQAYATENRDELFTEKKSMETPHGVLGFRTGTPKLKTRRGFTWPSVLNLLKKINPAYIRTSEEVAKNDLLADREKEETRQLFEEVGIYVDQDETFFVECKKRRYWPNHVKARRAIQQNNEPCRQGIGVVPDGAPAGERLRVGHRCFKKLF